MDVGAWGTTLPAAGLLDTRALCECRRSECGQHAREDHREQTDDQQPPAPVRVGGRASTIGHPSSPSPMYPPRLAAGWDGEDRGADRGDPLVEQVTRRESPLHRDELGGDARLVAAEQLAEVAVAVGTG